MKHVALFLLVAVFFTPSCDVLESDDDNWTKDKVITSPDESNISDSIKILIKIDAATLALRDVIKDSELKYQLLEIPPDLIELYYRGLIYIYNTMKYPPYNKLNGIHVFRNPPVFSIAVLFDTSYAWTKAWKRGERLTGNPQIDALMENYNLQLSYCCYDAASIFSFNPINTYALSNKFLGIPGVRISEPNFYMGDGADIKAEIKDIYLLYVFTVGWGDCPSGCLSRHFWEISVEYDGSVTLLREYGDPLSKQQI